MPSHKRGRTDSDSDASDDISNGKPVKQLKMSLSLREAMESRKTGNDAHYCQEENLPKTVLVERLKSLGELTEVETVVVNVTSVLTDKTREFIVDNLDNTVASLKEQIEAWEGTPPSIQTLLLHANPNQENVDTSEQNTLQDGIIDRSLSVHLYVKDESMKEKTLRAIQLRQLQVKQRIAAVSRRQDEANERALAVTQRLSTLPRPSSLPPPALPSVHATTRRPPLIALPLGCRHPGCYRPRHRCRVWPGVPAPARAAQRAASFGQSFCLSCSYPFSFRP